MEGVLFISTAKWKVKDSVSALYTFTPLFPLPTDHSEKAERGKELPKSSQSDSAVIGGEPRHLVSSYCSVPEGTLCEMRCRYLHCLGHAPASAWTPHSEVLPLDAPSNPLVKAGVTLLTAAWTVHLFGAPGIWGPLVSHSHCTKYSILSMFC